MSCYSHGTCSCLLSASSTQVLHHHTLPPNVSVVLIVPQVIFVRLVNNILKLIDNGQSWILLQYFSWCSIEWNQPFLVAHFNPRYCNFLITGLELELWSGVFVTCVGKCLLCCHGLDHVIWHRENWNSRGHLPCTGRSMHWHWGDNRWDILCMQWFYWVPLRWWIIWSVWFSNITQWQGPHSDAGGGRTLGNIPWYVLRIPGRVSTAQSEFFRIWWCSGQTQSHKSVSIYLVSVYGLH